MRYLITDGSRNVLAAIDVPESPDGDTVAIGIERADRPNLLFVGADLHGSGTVSVGHWPDGEEWESLVRTAGVPGPLANPEVPTDT